MDAHKTPNFFIDFHDLKEKVDQLEPLSYIKNRNFLNGSVSYLSPFISHGIISVKDIAESVLFKYPPQQIEKMLFQLAWREYFHRIWQNKGRAIFSSMNIAQEDTISNELPHHILAGTTHIDVIDQSISHLYQTGYMHNHERLWYASLVCNIAKSHWQSGAKWMYFHLLDGDLASNSLSWQWVAGTLNKKRYIANQENINKYSGTKQVNSYLNVSYDALSVMEVPKILKQREIVTLSNHFPQSTLGSHPKQGDCVFLYHINNLDPLWRRGDLTSVDKQVIRVLLIEPDLLNEYPLGPKRWRFILHWVKQIPDLKIFVGSLTQLFPYGFDGIEIISREYPMTIHWPGIKDEREWIFPETTEYYASFFKYWKHAKKELYRQG